MKNRKALSLVFGGVFFLSAFANAGSTSTSTTIVNGIVTTTVTDEYGNVTTTVTSLNGDQNTYNFSQSQSQSTCSSDYTTVPEDYSSKEIAINKAKRSSTTTKDSSKIPMPEKVYESEDTKSSTKTNVKSESSLRGGTKRSTSSSKKTKKKNSLRNSVNDFSDVKFKRSSDDTSGSNNQSTNNSYPKSDKSSSEAASKVVSISSKVSASQFELSIIAEVNLMRSNPKAYAEKYIAPRVTPNSSSYWKSCVSDMSKITNLCEFSYAEGLYQASKEHSTTQGKTSQTGHTRTNGKSWSDSIKKYGTYNMIAENISYGAETPREIVIQLLVDEGVSSLGHRINLLNKDYNCIGISFDPHQYYRYMCVMNFARGWKDK